MTALSVYPLGSIAERVTVGHVGTTSAYYCPDGIMFLRTQNVGENALLLDDVKYVTSEFHARLAKSQIKSGDLLLSRVITDKVRVAVVPQQFPDANCANIVVVRPGKKIDSKYLARYIASPDAQRQLLSGRVGSAQTVVNTTVVKKWTIPLPPLEEQKLIAAILDAADALRPKRRESLAQLDTLLQSTFLEMFGDPVTNPKGLPKETLKTAFRFTTGKLDSNAAVDGGRYPFFTCARETFAIDKYAFDCEALLLAGNNANADYSVKHYKGKFNAYQRTYVITVDEGKLTYRYAQVALEYMLADLKRYSKGTNTKYLTMAILERMPIIIPPLDLQRRFAAIVESVEHQKARLREHLAELDTLFASLQHRAFNGDL